VNRRIVVLGAGKTGEALSAGFLSLRRREPAVNYGWYSLARLALEVEIDPGLLAAAHS